MPLRPLTELGLVDVTELGPREDGDTAARRTSSARASRREATKPKRSSNKRSSNKSTGARARAPKTSTRSAGGAARPRADPARKPARGDSNRGDGGKMPLAQGAFREDLSHEETKRSVIVGAGPALLGGAIGIAGALLFARSVLRR